MGLKILRYVHEATAPDRKSVAWFDLVELGLVVLGFVLYFLVRGGVVDRTGEALAHARWIIDTQRSVGLFVEPVLNSWVLGAAWRVRLFNFVYFWFDFPLIVTVGLV